MCVRGVLAETWWKWVATCGKVLADEQKMTTDGSKSLRGPGRGVCGRAET